MRVKYYGYALILIALSTLIMWMTSDLSSFAVLSKVPGFASQMITATETVAILTPTATEPESPLPTPDETQSVSPLPRPTCADGGIIRADGLLVTPLPDEQLKVGEIVEIVPTPAPSPESPKFSIQNEFQGDETNRLLTLFVTDVTIGMEQRLGDDNGSAVFGTMDNTRVIWSFLCNPCATFQQGLYTYSPNTGSLFLTAQSGSKPKLDQNWILYLYVENMSSVYSDLYANNLVTGEHLLIADDFAKVQSGIDNYFAIAEGKVVWVAMGQPPSMNIYTLDSHSTRQLTVPEIAIPVHLSIQGDMVIWLDEFWQGYDLNADAYFTIPVVPEQWENVVIQQASTVIAVNNQLNWNLTIDNQTHYLTAPVIPNTQESIAAPLISLQISQLVLNDNTEVTRETT